MEIAMHIASGCGGREVHSIKDCARGLIET